jgi:hypothetical protein
LVGRPGRPGRLTAAARGSISRLDALDDRLLGRLGALLAALARRLGVAVATLENRLGVIGPSELEESYDADPRLPDLAADGRAAPKDDRGADDPDAVGPLDAVGPRSRDSATGNRGVDDPDGPDGRVGGVPPVRYALLGGARVVAAVIAALIVVAVASAVVHGPAVPSEPAGPEGSMDAGPSIAAATPGPPEVTILPAPASSGAGGGTVVGPTAGTAPANYVAAARRRLDTLATSRPGDVVSAVVDFADYRTPADLIAMTSGYRLTRIFFRAPPAGETFAAEIQDPSADVSAALSSAAAKLGERAGAEPDNDRRQALIVQSSALLDGRACLFGVVVRAEAGRLRALATVPGVRVVDPAETATYDPAAFVPLDPASP